MSSQLVGLSPDLVKLIEEEYDIEVREGNLLVHHVPYVSEDGTVQYGVLVSELTTNGERTDRPGSHWVGVVGGVPFDHQGNRLTIINDPNPHDFGGGVVSTCSLSAKRRDEHPPDYYVKMTTYVRILGDFARAIDPSTTHKGFPVRETSEDQSVFRYHDAATSRTGISAVTAKLKRGKVAIVGLGGTGSYILDQVAKTPVEEVHLYDDDVLLAHNAFRSPAAAPLEVLRESPRKVDYLFRLYDPIRRGIFPHPEKIDATNVNVLREMAFVFLAIDGGPAKKVIIERLESWGIPFVDCGMGLRRQENSLRGVLRATTGAVGHYSHIRSRVSFAADEDADEYDWNIQTADLNMLNAAMAVIKWKKLLGYYVDDREEHNSAYTVARNQMTNGDAAE